MRKRVAEILMTIAKILPFVVMLALVALYLPNKDAVSVDSILPVYAGQPVAGRPGGAGGLRPSNPCPSFSPCWCCTRRRGCCSPCPLPFWSICPACWCVSPSLRHRPLCGQGSGGQPAEKI